MEKHARKAPDQFATAEVWNPDGTPKVLVRIEGLAQVGLGEFELSGVKPRDIDWPAVSRALGIEGPMDDQLADDIGDVVFRHDILRILSERCKLA